MKAVTLEQPLASLVAMRKIEIVSASWGTRYRGPLAIHASTQLHDAVMGAIVPAFEQELLRAFECTSWPELRDTIDALPRNAVVAKVDLYDVVRSSALFVARRPLESGFTAGVAQPVLWFVRKVEPLEPPPPAERMSSGLWEWKHSGEEPRR